MGGEKCSAHVKIFDFNNFLKTKYYLFWS